MSDDPPSDGPDDPGVDDVLEQLDVALTDAGVTDPEMRAALADNLKGALDRLGELGEVDLTVDVVTTRVEGEGDDDTEPDDHGPPEVTVVDGGRTRGQPRVSGPRPDLRVAAGEGAGGDDPVPGAARTVRGRRLGSLARDGRIDVPADGRQAVYRGQQAHPYRVLCRGGRLAVSVDGVTLETLAPGQSVDVEGAAIVVLAVGEDRAAGSYVRLR